MKPSHPVPITLLFTALLWAASAAAQTAGAPATKVLDLDALRWRQTASPSERLADAACRADERAVAESLRQNPDHETTLKVGDTEGTPLFLATACYGGADEARLKIVEHLLDVGADVRAIGLIEFEKIPVRMPALVAAAYNRRADLVDLLVQRGADPSITDLDHEGTALIWAAESNCVACVEPLVRAGAQIDRRNGFALTALYVAALRGDSAMTTELLGRGANPLVKDAAGTSIVDATPDDNVRDLLIAARRKRIATYAAWGLSGVFVAGVGLFYWLRREET